MRLAIVIDTDYRSEDNYAYDTEAETRAAVEEEQSKLDSGEWAAYGVVAYKPCGHDDHGWECAHAVNLAAVWGVVVESGGCDGDYEDYGQLPPHADGHLVDTARNVWEEGESQAEKLPTPTDAEIIDAIATYLGTASEWSGGDALDMIARLLGQVRPHPGDLAPDAFAAAFAKQTGRPAPAAFDQREH